MTIPSITPESINRYTNRFNRLSDSWLEDLINQSAKRQDIVPCIQKDTAYFLQFIVRIMGPQRVLELGTGIGISTLVIAAVLPAGGLITTIERGDKFVKEAQENFQRFKVGNIDLIPGDAAEIVFELRGIYDLIFQDSGKQTYPQTLDRLVQLLRPGGLLLADDTLFPAIDLPNRNHTSQVVINEFNKAVRNHNLLESYILPIGHGVTLAIKSDKESLTY